MSLHGGPIGFDSMVWTVLRVEEAPQLFSRAEIEHVQGLPPKTFAFFCLISPDGDQGYPGELLTEALIALVPATAGGGPVAKIGHVVIVYRSKLVGQKKAVTPINLTQVIFYDSVTHEPT